MDKQISIIDGNNGREIGLHIGGESRRSSFWRQTRVLRSPF